MSEEYEPFGNKWKNELLKWTKVEIVKYLRNALIEKKKSKSEISAIIKRCTIAPKSLRHHLIFDEDLEKLIQISNNL